MMLLQQAPAPGGFPVGWDLVVAVVAVLALIQPWLLWLYRKFVRPGSAEFYESGKMSIYFWTGGCGLELIGTVKANHEDQFLRSMAVVIVRGNNVARHTFDWRSFRYSVVDFQGVSKSDFGIASSLMVTTAKPEYLDTIFFEPASERELEELGERVKALWRPYFSEREAEATAAAAPAPVTVATSSSFVPSIVPATFNPIDVNQVFEEFSQTADVVAVRADLDRACLWRVGDYAFTLNLVTDQPVKTFAHPGSFHLAEADVQALRGNLDAMLRAWCNVLISSPIHDAPVVAYQLRRP